MGGGTSGWDSRIHSFARFARARAPLSYESTIDRAVEDFESGNRRVGSAPSEPPDVEPAHVPSRVSHRFHHVFGAAWAVTPLAVPEAHKDDPVATCGACVVEHQQVRALVGVHVRGQPTED